MASAKEERIARIKSVIKDYPDYPKPGIVFKDIMGIMANISIFNDTIDWFYEQAMSLNTKVDLVVGLEARGFLFGPTLAQRLNVGFVPIRKSGKLPGECISQSYIKEYGEDVFDVQVDAIGKGASVLIVDDLVAVGGTMEAAVRLVTKAGGCVAACLVLVELTFLNGRQRIQPAVLKSLMQVDSE